MSFLRFEFPDLKQHIAALAKLNGQLTNEYAKTVYQSAEQVMTLSKEQYVPVDTGALRASGHVVPPKTDREKVTVELAFGGPAADYAVWVHENLDAHHNVGQAKYLEIPLRESLDKIQRDLDDATARAIRNAGLKL